jgi:hypothetical protein
MPIRPAHPLQPLPRRLDRAERSRNFPDKPLTQPRIGRPRGA